MKGKGRAIGTILFGIVLFIFIFLIRLADWYIDWFSTAGFSIVVYQLRSPLQGTAGEIMDGFKQQALYTSILISLALIVIGFFFDCIFNNNDLRISIRINKRSRDVCIKGSGYRKFKRFLSAVLIIALLSLLVNRVYAVGIPQYVREISDSSTLYEEEYVDPDTVALTFPEQKRNLIILYIESMEASYMDVENGGNADVNYIPELTQLARDNVNFSPSDKLGGFDIYGIGFTMAGLLASSAGINYKIPVRNETANYFSVFLPGVTALGDILAEHGYHNYFLCGSDGEFGGREQFYTQHGDYEILDLEYADEAGYIPHGYHNESWGYEDTYLYEIAKDELTSIAAAGEPFNFTMLTVDTHGPAGYVCEKCEDQFADQYANVLSCASRQAYDFIRWVQQQDWYEDTTILIMGDHTSMVAQFMDYSNGYEKQVYDCYVNVADGLDRGSQRTNNRIFSTLDIFPTTLAVMGVKIEGNRLGLGVNLFSDEPTLPERFGSEHFYEELQRNSNFYVREFIR